MKKQKLDRQKKLLYDVICAKEYRPMRGKEIAILLDVPKAKRTNMLAVLDQLVVEGKIKQNKKGQYVKCKLPKLGKLEALKEEHRKKKVKQFLKQGRFISHHDGFGFVELEEEEADDIFIPRDGVADAFHHDLVEVEVKPNQTGKRMEGRIVRIVERDVTSIIGTYEDCGNFGFVVPDNTRYTKDIFVSREKADHAQTGDKVMVSILKYGGPNQKPEGKITEILGASGTPGIDVLSIARGYDLPMEFSEKVMAQAAKTKDTLIPGDFQGRKDLRDWTVVTIDGEDAKDLDDGISLTKEGDIYHLGVHIADVSNYVQYHSAMDKEALKRGTSVYLVDRVIPMLPKRLSNGICSLNQGEDRLALSCLMDINARGEVISHEIAETVICVNRRMTYTNVKKIVLEEDAQVTEEYKELVPMFFLMKELSAIIRANRSKRGSIDFDFPESKIELNELGKPVRIYPYEQNVATKIIEDFMLIANETVAKEYCLAELPFVYRTHDNPDPEKMEATLTFIRAQGFDVKKSKEEISPKEIQKAMEQIKDSPKEALISRLLLRSMKQARYTTDCSGHFGLAAKYYCHFTSPIRRYPDLQIHRIIKDNLRGRLNKEKQDAYWEILDDVAKQSSAMERRAEEVERETNKLKKAEYMQDHIGEVYDGVISGVTGWGIYVELPNTVEGLVHMTQMKDDYYTYDDINHQLVGEREKKVYGLGQQVRIRVMDADIINKTVDFALETE